MKHHTPKRASIEREYQEVKAAHIEAMLDDCGYVFCEGCLLTNGVIECSHHVPRSRRRDLIADPRNIAMMCRERCHKLVESGRFSELDNGDTIRAYIEEMEPELLVLQALRQDNLAA